MHEVQTRMRLVVAPTRACTGRKFTFQRRLVTLWAWLMRFPDCGFLPQISHCCAMTAIHPFTGSKRSHYSTGFCPRRQFAQVYPSLAGEGKLVAGFKAEPGENTCRVAEIPLWSKA